MMKDLSQLNTSEDILKYYSDTVFLNQENQQQHNPYDQELRETQAIENGDMDQLQKSLEEIYSGQLGRLARDELRNIRNIAIVNAVLSSRAAIRGGLLPEISFTLCDAYIQKIEEINSTDALQKLMRECKFHYCQLVSDTKAERSMQKKKIPHSRITLCKNYIFSHLHQKLKVQDIAEELNTTPSYLADLFRLYEGQSISSFILHEKIKLVKNMLIYSPYTYSQIAAYLGFSSQSHLGAQFKKVTGFTLRQYRERFRNLSSDITIKKN